MRKVIVCDKITATIKTKATQFGIAEITVGIPPVMAGALKDVSLPAIVLESATHPHTFLLAKSLADTSPDEINQLQDLDKIPEAPDVVTLHDLIAKDVTPKLVLIDDHEARLADLESRLKALEGK